MLSRTHRIAGVGAAVFLAVGLVGTGVATAAPTPSSSECTDAVNLNLTVIADRAAVNTAIDNLNTATKGGDPTAIAAAQSNLDRANAVLNADVKNVRTRLCTGTVTTTTPDTTVVVVPPTTVVRDVPFGDDKDCSDFDSQEAAQSFFLAHRSAAQPDPDRLDANGNGIACEGAQGDVAVRAIVNATTVNEDSRSTNSTTHTTTSIKDDGSVPTLSGSQVTAAPVGSVDTGEAW